MHQIRVSNNSAAVSMVSGRVSLSPSLHQKQRNSKLHPTTLHPTFVPMVQLDFNLPTSRSASGQPIVPSAIGSSVHDARPIALVVATVLFFVFGYELVARRGLIGHWNVT